MEDSMPTGIKTKSGHLFLFFFDFIGCSSFIPNDSFSLTQ